MYRNIVFDLGGILFTNGTKLFLQKLSSRYPLTPNQIKEVLDGKLGSAYRTAQITRDQFWQQVISTLNLQESADELEDEWISSYSLISSTKRLIQQLNSAGYHTYYLSDNVKERVEKLDHLHHFQSLFKGGLYSHQAKIRKPNPKIYQLLLEKFSLNPQETIFIDDKEKNLVPAKKLGITTILCTDPANLPNQLTTLNIHPKL